MGLPRTICLIALAFSVGSAGTSWAKVGVTSAAEGEPIGKPPAEQERILRVGIDVQANEQITTKGQDRAHLVFLDGTSISVGPNSSLAIDKFVYDPDSKKGELSLNAAKGVFRLVGGNLSKGNEVVVQTPSASIGIRGGIMTFEVSPTGVTNAIFLYGDSMRVSAQGDTKVATREGSVIHTEMGGHPSPPTIIPPHGLATEKSFEKSAGTTQTRTTTAVTTTAAIEKAFESSGFSQLNSKSSPTLISGPTGKGSSGKGTPTATSKPPTSIAPLKPIKPLPHINPPHLAPVINNGHH